MELVDRYLDGTLSPGERQAFEERLRTSTELRELLDDQRALREGVERLAVRALVMKAHSGWSWGKWKPFIGGAAITAAVVTGTVLFMLSGERSGKTTEVAAISIDTLTTDPTAIVPSAEEAPAYMVTDTIIDTVYQVIRKVERGRIAPTYEADSASYRTAPQRASDAGTIMRGTQRENTGEPFALLSSGSMPAYPGGFQELHRYLQRTIRQPEGVECSGTLILAFTVDEKGHVQDPHVVRGLSNACDQEALRVVRTMPDWIPAQDKNGPVRGEVSMPLVFAFR